MVRQPSIRMLDYIVWLVLLLSCICAAQAGPLKNETLAPNLSLCFSTVYISPLFHCLFVLLEENRQSGTTDLHRRTTNLLMKLIAGILLFVDCMCCVGSQSCCLRGVRDRRLSRKYSNDGSGAWCAIGMMVMRLIILLLSNLYRPLSLSNIACSSSVM